MKFAGEPRSMVEMEFAAGLYPCEFCGDHRPLETKVGGSGGIWIVRGYCPRCNTERKFVFESDADLLAEDPDLYQLGDERPSTVLSPLVLMREYDRLVPAISLDPARLSPAEWPANADRVERLRTTLEELVKFIPPGEAEIPPDAQFDDDGRADQRARPERYTRTWLDEQRTDWKQVAQALTAGARAAHAANPILSRKTPPRGRINEETLAAHRQWLDRGRTGTGRLDVVTTDASELSLDGVQMQACRLEGVLLEHANLAYVRLDDADLIDVQLTGSRLGFATLDRASLRGCKLDGVDLTLARLERVRLADSSVERAKLDRSLWLDAIVERTSLRGAAIGNARLDRARFTGCDLREVVFAPAAAEPPATSVGAVFNHCDLRGADFTGRDLSGTTFLSCKLGGAHGVPAKTDGWRVLDADFSDAGDGSDVGGAADLLEELAG